MYAYIPQSTNCVTGTFYTYDVTSPSPHPTGSLGKPTSTLPPTLLVVESKIPEVRDPIRRCAYAFMSR